jgi:S-adenosylmethionine hydrolase
LTVLTLTTDFGAGDHEAGVLKGVVWRIAPEVKIVDLSHDIAPQDVFEGALVYWRNAHYFPAGTVHVGVVDPGVGTQRRVVGGKVGDQYFVGPDNGLFSLVQARAEENGWPVEWYELNKREYWLPSITHIFHGRDIFSPAGAHLAAGVALEAMGDPIEDPERLDFPNAERTPAGWCAPIIHRDYFGNLAVNLRREQLDGRRDVFVHVGGATIEGLVDTFGQRGVGELAALFDSSGLLSIAVVNGDAAESLGLDQGDWVDVEFSPVSKPMKIDPPMDPQ